MTYNEAVVEAREQASKTSRSWFIFTNGREDYRVADNRNPTSARSPSNRQRMRIAAVVNPVWKE